MFRDFNFTSPVSAKKLTHRLSRKSIIEGIYFVKGEKFGRDVKFKLESRFWVSENPLENRYRKAL